MNLLNSNNQIQLLINELSNDIKQVNVKFTFSDLTEGSQKDIQKEQQESDSSMIEIGFKEKQQQIINHLSNLKKQFQQYKVLEMKEIEKIKKHENFLLKKSKSDGRPKQRFKFKNQILGPGEFSIPGYLNGTDIDIKKQSKTQMNASSNLPKISTQHSQQQNITQHRLPWRWPPKVGRAFDHNQVFALDEKTKAKIEFAEKNYLKKIMTKMQKQADEQTHYPNATWKFSSRNLELLNKPIIDEYNYNVLSYQHQLPEKKRPQPFRNPQMGGDYFDKMIYSVKDKPTHLNASDKDNEFKGVDA